MNRSSEYYRERAKQRHPLHLKIGDLFHEILEKTNYYELIRDEACGGDQQIPLFIEPMKSNKAQYCNVDLLVIREQTVRLIVEIEESNLLPTHVCGKYLAAALSRYYIHESKKDVPIGMHENVTFIQFLDTSKLKRDKTSKIDQWNNIEISIRELLPVTNSNIGIYKIFDVSEASLEKYENKNTITDFVIENLSAHVHKER